MLVRPVDSVPMPIARITIGYALAVPGADWQARLGQDRRRGPWLSPPNRPSGRWLQPAPGRLRRRQTERQHQGCATGRMPCWYRYPAQVGLLRPDDAGRLAQWLLKSRYRTG